MPQCPTNKSQSKKSLVEALGLNAFALFKQKKMALFFIFSILLGVSLQITNGFANPFISDFGQVAEYANTFGVQHANILISLSQVSETLCILLIPFCLKRFGIKKVMLMAMFAWVLRFGLFGLGNPGAGVWMFLLSMIVSSGPRERFLSVWLIPVLVLPERLAVPNSATEIILLHLTTVP